jgi:hypothetical protein
MMTETPDQTDEPQKEQRQIRDCGTTPIYLHHGTPYISVAKAVEKATYPDEDPGEASIKLIPEQYDELGVVPGQIMSGEFAKDGRSADNWRSIEETGDGEYVSYRVSLPDDVLDALGIEEDDIGSDVDENPLVRLFAGEGVIGIDRPDVREITISNDVDIVELLGPEAGRDYREVVENGRDPAEVAQEHQRSTEMVRKNVSRAKRRRRELEEAGYDL